MSLPQHIVYIAAVVFAGTGCRGIEPLSVPGALDSVGSSRVSLGHNLFFDSDLSGDRSLACVSCHDLEAGGADERATSTGIGGQTGRRNAPSVFNASLKFRQFWDGRVERLGAQALEPITAANEMGLSQEELVRRLKQRPEVAAAFAAAFPDEAQPVTAMNVALALEAYQRRLAWPGRVDRFLQGDEAALSASERAGYDYFAGNCAFCHDGPGVGGQRYERLGDQVPWPEERSSDLGLMEVTQDSQDKLRFVVPSLRHVGSTGPYFHDGSVATLEEAVELMAKHQLDETLSEEQVNDVAAFLRALDGDVPGELVTAPAGYGEL